MTSSVRTLCATAPSPPPDVEVDSADEESEGECTDATAPSDLTSLDPELVQTALLGARGVDEKLAVLAALCGEFDKARFPSVGPSAEFEAASADSGSASDQQRTQLVEQFVEADLLRLRDTSGGALPLRLLSVCPVRHGWRQQ